MQVSQGENAKQRMLRRRRRSVILAVLLLVTGLLTVKLVGSSVADRAGAVAGDVAVSIESTGTPPTPPGTAPTQEPSESQTPRKPAATPPSVVAQGNGKWTYAKPPAHPDTFGDSGTLLTFNIAVEGGTDQKVAPFAKVVTDTLSDKRSWIAGKQWQFTQVGDGYADFTVYLASPSTRAQLCGADDTYTSCRNGNAVVLNLERWLLGVPHWTGSLDTYRQYVVNHEVGHRLGEGHVVCPKKGKPSPVMAQQTLELRGCNANAWPFVDGKYVTGPAGEYQ